MQGRMRRMGGFILTATLLLMAAAAPAELAHYWVKFPHPKKIYVTADVDQLPNLAPGKDPGKTNGALGFTLTSLSGLAALSAREGKCDAMIWFNMPGNMSYNLWLEKIFAATGAERVDGSDSLALIKEFARRKVVKGYILYRADASKRDLYGAKPETAPGYSNSVNVATTLAPLYHGIIVEESIEPAIKALGLKCLMDVRDKNEAWCFEQYKGKLNRSLVSALEPKIPHCRDYAIATRSFCLFGTGPLTDQVLAWAEPNSPIIGWNADDEYTQTSQFSRWGKFQTACNWCINLPLTSIVRAGDDVPWEDLQVNTRSRVDPLALDWPRDTHFTSFVCTDGDNLQWYMGGFFSNSNDYWNAPSRTSFPFGWTAPMVCMSQVAVPTLALMARSASPNDQAVMFGGGYYYAEEYGKSLPDQGKVLDSHIDQLADTMDRLGLRVLKLNNFNWKSEQTRQTYARFAKRIPHLAGILAIQYNPYTAGQGEILWTENREGEQIPIISARYGLWAEHKIYQNEGPPAAVADFLNKAAHEGPVTSDAFIDWTTVHVWSYFKKAQTDQDLWAEDLDQKLAGKPGTYRGLEPVGWCVNRLKPHVKVVTPEELVWRARLCLKTRPTLDGLAAQLEKDPRQDARTRQGLAAYRAWLAKAPLDSDEQRREAFQKLRALRFSQWLETRNLIY